MIMLGCKTSSRLILPICLLLSLPLSIMGQVALTAEEVMNRTTETYKSDGGKTIEFVMRTNEGNSTGVISLKGESFVIDVQGVQTWFDGHTQWSLLKQNEEVNISTPTSEELQAINPYSWLTAYKKGYSLNLLTDKSKNNGTYNIEMVALSGNKDMQKIVLEIDSKTFVPKHIIMSSRKGRDIVSIDVVSYKAHLAFADSFFSFDKQRYPDVEIIDLR